ncbi:MAG: LacI family DNA-binding transcriptional regulator [Phycisphaerales bacterium]
MVTSQDIARLAGVHQSTVSRVLSGFPRVSKATVKKVRRACEELGYVPNAMARSLRTSRPMAIAVHIPLDTPTAIADPFVPSFLTAVGREAASHGYSMMLPAQGPGDDSNDDLDMMVRGRRVDGVIITTPRHDDPRVRLLNEQRIPCVFGRFNKKLGPLSSCVDIDNINKGEQAAGYLLHRGHRRIGVIGEPEGWLPGDDLWRGIKKRLSQAGVAIDRSLLRCVPVTFEAAFEAAGQLLQLPDPPTAIIADTALTVFAVIEAVRQSGGGSGGGRRTLVLGPDSPLLSKLHPHLPRIELPVDSLGRAMAHALIQTIETGERQPIHLLRVRILDEQGEPFIFKE